MAVVKELLLRAKLIHREKISRVILCDEFDDLMFSNQLDLPFLKIFSSFSLRSGVKAT